ncbi:DUF1127 domain-containing protein [Jannaschia sp. W003]|nr:DUF1127 domain-containing protein [Jannaschia sp. W003]UWQ22538.1 DUF1127 domain-containing protein [Jannaschia sp. W003]
MTRYDTLRARWADRTARRTTRRALLSLDERQLEDIGLNRADVDVRFG